MLRRATWFSAAFLAFCLSPAVADQMAPTPPDAGTPPAVIDQTPPIDPQMAAAMDLMDASDGRDMAAVELSIVCEAFFEEFRQYRYGALRKRSDEFVAAFGQEAAASIDAIAAKFTQTFASHYSESDLRALSAFFRSDLYQRFRAALPQQIAAMGVFNLLAFSNEGGAKMRQVHDLYAKYETPEDMSEVAGFAQSDVGQRANAGLKKISEEMSYNPGWLLNAGQRAKDRALARLHLEGVHL